MKLRVEFEPKDLDCPGKILYYPNGGGATSSYFITGVDGNTFILFNMFTGVVLKTFTSNEQLVDFLNAKRFRPAKMETVVEVIKVSSNNFIEISDDLKARISEDLKLEN